MAGRNFSVSVRSNVKQVIASIEADGLTRKDQEKAAVRALNRAGDRARTAAARAMVARYNLKYGEALDVIQISRAYAGRLVMALSARGKPMSLGRFLANKPVPGQRKPGVKVRILKGGTKDVKGAFVQNIGGYLVVLKRKGKGRYPLRGLRTVDVPGMLSRKEVQPVLEGTALEVFEQEFGRQLELALKRQVG